MEENLRRRSGIWYYRLILFILIGFTQIREQILQCGQIEGLSCLRRNKYLSIQTNWMLFIWLGLMLFANSEIRKRIAGFVHGAMVVYITIVMVVYWSLIASTDPTVNTFTNYSQHLVVPIMFIIEWYLTEDRIYHRKYIFYWLLYPLLFAPYAIINGSLGWELGYIYPFLNVPSIGWASVLLTIMAIFVFYMFMSSFYVWINHRYQSERTSLEILN